MEEELEQWPGTVVTPEEVAGTDEEEQQWPGQALDPELQALLERNPDITITGDNIDDPRVPVGGSLALDVTEQVRAAGQEQQGPRDYEYYWGNDMPDVDFMTRLSAGLADLSDFLQGVERPPNEAQQARDEADAAANALMEEYRAYYEDAPTAEDYGMDIPGVVEFTGSMNDIRLDVRLNPTGEEGEISVEYNRIPNPDSSAGTRILEQTFNNLYQEFGGLLTEGAILSESELDRRVPDYEPTGAESLFTDLLSFGLPAFGAERATRTALTGLRLANQATRTGRWVGALGGVSGASIAEAIMSGPDSETMIFTPEMVAEAFKIDDPQRAEDMSMLLDGMLLNGTFDGFVYLAGRAAGFVGERFRGARAIFDPQYLRDRSERAALLGIVTSLDPERVVNGQTLGLETLSNRQMPRALTNLAAVLEANSQTIVRIGETVEEVPLDTVNAISRGAAEYIRATYPQLRRGMSDAEWDAFVQAEAVNMTERMIGIARSQEGNAVVRQGIMGMSDAVDRAITGEANRLLEPTELVENPLGAATNTLVDQRNADIAAATADLGTAEELLAQTQRAIGTAVENDPFIQTLLEQQNPLRFFDNAAETEQLREMLGEELFQQFRNGWRAVEDAYAAIPNVPIDTEAFVDSVNAVVQEANILDSSGARTRQILGQIYRAVQPQAALDEAGEVVFESVEELVDRLDGQIGFQDLYRVRQRVSQMIGDTSDPAIAARLRELSQSITDAEDGQLAFVMRSGDPEAAQAAEFADMLYMEQRSRFYNSEPMRQFSELAEARNVGVNTPTDPAFLQRGEADLNAQSVRDILPTTLSDQTGYLFETLRQAFDNPATRRQLDASVADLYVAEGTRRLVAALRNNDGQTADLIIQSFQEQARVLRETNNPLFQQLEEAAQRVERMQAELGSDALVADALVAEARQQLEQAQNTIVSRFVRDRFPELATSSPQAVVTTMLSSADAGDQIAELMAQIDRLPEVQREATRQAFQGAILRSLRDRVFGSSPIGIVEGGTSVNVRAGNLQAITDEVRSSVLEGVRQAFPDSPEIVEGISQALTTLTDTTAPSRLRLAVTGSPTAANLGVRETVSTAILFSLGYMNPTAAAARRVTSEVVDRFEARGRQHAVDTVAGIIAAPQEFAALARAIARRENPSVLRQLQGAFLEAVVDGFRYEIRTPEGDLMNDTAEMWEDLLNSFMSEGNVPEGFEE